MALIILIAGRVLHAAEAQPTLAYISVQRAQSKAARTGALVENGTLAPLQLRQAEERLADAQDELTLTKTLYGMVRVQDLSDTDAKAMLDAAAGAWSGSNN